MPPAKRRKYSHLQPQLTDLNHECLCEIFGYLNIDDLGNISQISESFKSVAERIISRASILVISKFKEMRHHVIGPHKILVINRPLFEIEKLPSFLYKYTKDLQLVDLPSIQDDDAEKLFREMIHLTAVSISFCHNLTGVCLKPLKNLTSAQFKGFDPSISDFESFLKRNPSLEVLGFTHDNTEFCAQEIAQLENLHTLSWHTHEPPRFSISDKVAKMNSLRKVSYNPKSLNGDFLRQINATNVVQKLDMYGLVKAVPTFPHNSNIKVLRLQSMCVLKGYTKVLKMNNLEELTLKIYQCHVKIPKNFIMTLIQNLPKLKKLELKVDLLQWIQPNDEIEKVLRLRNRKLEICLADKLRPLIKWSSSEEETCLEFTFVKDWNRI